MMKRLLTLGLVVGAVFAVAATSHFKAGLSPKNEVGGEAIHSKARGSAHIWVDDETFEFSGFIQISNLSSDVIGYHVHLASAGENGPVVIDLGANEVGRKVVGNTVRLYFEGDITPFYGSPTIIRKDIVRAMRSGNAYFNVHTEDYPGGEARGQIR